MFMYTDTNPASPFLIGRVCQRSEPRLQFAAGAVVASVGAGCVTVGAGCVAVGAGCIAVDVGLRLIRRGDAS